MLVSLCDEPSVTQMVRYAISDGGKEREVKRNRIFKQTKKDVDQIRTVEMRQKWAQVLAAGEACKAIVF